MNRIHRVVWNACTGVWQAVAESSRTRARTRRTRLGGATCLALLAFAAHGADLPSGGAVSAGSGSIAQDGSAMTIRQSSDKLAIDWQSFSIGEGHSVTFEQPSASAVALNRVLGTDASRIHGSLNANGQVFLLNPNGVVFSPGARVDVGGLVASTLALGNDDFMAGNYVFSGDSQAAIVNQGEIRAAEGGHVVMIAARIDNEGLIEAHRGSVQLAAGSRVTLDIGGPARLDVEQSALDALIANGGAIRADGGTILLTAHAVEDLTRNVINNTGTIEARGIGRDEQGRITLWGEGGIAEVAGRIDTTADEGSGGDIVITSNRVLIGEDAVLDSSGALGGGDIFVGGGWQGKDASVKNADMVIALAGARIDADATTDGDAGTVVFWADDAMQFAGSITARGGSEGGDGGAVEVSGKERLGFSGTVDTRAPAGKDGHLLLDPNNIRIVSGSAGTTGSYAEWSNQNNTTNYVIAETVLEALTGTVELNARNDIIIEALADGVLDLQATSIYFFANDEPSLTATGGFRMMDTSNTIRLNSNNGVLHIQGGRLGGGASDSCGGAVGPCANNTTTGRSMLIGNLETAGSGVELFVKRNQTATPIELVGNITTQGGDVTIAPSARGGANSTVVNVILNGHIDTAGGSFSSSMTGTVQVNGGMDLGAGTATFAGTGTQINSLITSTSDVSVSSPLSFGVGSGITTNGTITFADTASMLAGGSLILTANDFIFNETFTGNNADITLKPFDTGTSVDIGAAGSGDMLISADALSKLSGFRDIVIGRVDGTGITRVVDNTAVTTSGSIELINATIEITGGSLTNTDGDIILTGNMQEITEDIIANGGAGKVTLQQLTAANEIVLGGDTVLNADLAKIFASTLVIGRPDGGNVSFANDMSTSATTVHIRSGGTVTGVLGGVSAANLAITAGAGATLTSNTFDFGNLALEVGGDTTVRSSQGYAISAIDGVGGVDATGHTLTIESTGNGTITTPAGISADRLLLLGSSASFDLSGATHDINVLAADVGSGLTIHNSGALSIGNIGGTHGVRATGPVYLSTATGNLDLAQPINTADASAAAIVLNAGVDAAAGTAAGGDIVAGSGATLTTGTGGRALLYTGSLSGSTGVMELAGAGSGRFRYNSDESTTNFTAPLGGVGVYVIYREQPMLAVTPDGISITYGDATPAISHALSGFRNGDTLAQAGVSGTAVFATGGATSGAGFKVAGTHEVAYTSGLASELGYGFVDDISSTGELEVARLNLAVTGLTVIDKEYDGTTAATLGGAGSVTPLTGDDVTVAGTAGAAFVSADAGNAIEVVLSGVSPGGTDGANYILVAPASFTGNILPRALAADLTGTSSKVYDGTASIALGSGDFLLTGFIAGQSATIGAGGQFNSANVADANTITVTLAADNFTAATGTRLENYILPTSAPIVGAGTITARPVTVRADNLLKAFQQPDPALTYRAEAFGGGRGLVPGETLTGTLVRVAGEEMGQYAITQGSLLTANNPNYIVAFVGGTLYIGLPIPADTAVQTAQTVASQQATPIITTLPEVGTDASSAPGSGQQDGLQQGIGSLEIVAVNSSELSVEQVSAADMELLVMRHLADSDTSRQRVYVIDGGVRGAGDASLPAGLLLPSPGDQDEEDERKE